MASKAGQGGEAWVRLSWVLGLRKLGFDILFVEQIESDETGAGARFFQETMIQFGLADRAVLLGKDAVLFGHSMASLLAFASEAVALVNISGHLRLQAVMERVQRRIYVDIDPGFTQAWQAQGSGNLGLENHDVHFTIGENIGTTICPIPTCGISWLKTRAPVLLDEWPPVRNAGFKTFSTIANWRGAYGPVEIDGTTYGLKVHEFRKFIDLPRLTGLPFEIALNIHPADDRDLMALRTGGWCVKDPMASAGTAGSFRDYVQKSTAEFSVAQGVYAHTNSGWFSDRTAHYLACGRPALVQETGFSRNLLSGIGLIGFRTLEEAVRGAQSISANYQEHSRAARALAEKYFDSDVVLRLFCEDAGIEL